MTLLTVILFALMQGATELFPVSSLGHAVIVPAILHWHIDEHAPSFLPFVVMLHVGTATALLLYFWRTWIDIVFGVLGRYSPSKNAAHRKLLTRLIIATLPAVVIGFVLKKPIQHLFATPAIAAAFLIANAGMLLVGDRLRKRGPASAIGNMTNTDAVIIGFFQCLAFLPGLSRSGAAMVGGLARGLDHEDAARFSFLMATPVIAGATLVEVPKLLHYHSAAGSHMLGLAIVAAIASGVVAFVSTAILLRYFHGHDRWALGPFAAYCAGFGALALILLGVGL